MKYGGIFMENPIAITHEVRKEIIQSLKEISLPPHLKGYPYIKSGLEICLSQPDILESVTKEFYPQIASIHHTTPSRVERAIRHSIECIYDRGNAPALEEWFGYPDYNRGKPVNSEFFARMAENIRVRLDYDAGVKDQIPEACKDLDDEARLLQLRADLITLGVIKE